MFSLISTYRTSSLYGLVRVAVFHCGCSVSCRRGRREPKAENIAWKDLVQHSEAVKCIPVLWYRMCREIWHCNYQSLFCLTFKEGFEANKRNSDCYTLSSEEMQHQDVTQWENIHKIQLELLVPTGEKSVNSVRYQYSYYSLGYTLRKCIGRSRIRMSAALILDHWKRFVWNW